MIAILAFYLFATLTIASAVAVIFARNPVHSVLWLIMAFFNAAGLMLILGAEFIAMLLVIVYVGAVAVLFLFIVMMLDIDFAALRSGFTRNLPFGLLVALVLLAEIIVAVIARGRPGRVTGNAQPAATTQPNIEAIGELLYTRFLFPFEIAGLILLVAMIGAIVLTHRSRGDARGQNVLARSTGGPRMRSSNKQPRVGRGGEAVIGLTHYLAVAAILFTLGVLGIFLNRRNIILMLMAIELILLAVNINLVAFSAFLGDLVGQVFAMFVLTVAAAEAAIGLAILVIFFRRRGSIAVDDVNRMRG